MPDLVRAQMAGEPLRGAPPRRDAALPARAGRAARLPDAGRGAGREPTHRRGAEFRPARRRDAGARPARALGRADMACLATGAGPGDDEAQQLALDSRSLAKRARLDTRRSTRAAAIADDGGAGTPPGAPARTWRARRDAGIAAALTPGRRSPHEFFRAARHRLPRLRRRASARCSATSACSRWRIPTCRADRATRRSRAFPLRCVVCTIAAWCSSTPSWMPRPDLPDYAYFSSASATWLDHAARFAAAMVRALRARAGEASWSRSHRNDGYLLQNFVAAGIPCLGVEPAANVAAVARAERRADRDRLLRRGDGARARRRGAATPIWSSPTTCFAHVPDINDFIAGLAALAGPRGVVSIEPPHLRPPGGRRAVRHDLPRALRLLVAAGDGA